MAVRGSGTTARGAATWSRVGAAVALALTVQAGAVTTAQAAPQPGAVVAVTRPAPRKPVATKPVAQKPAAKKTASAKPAAKKVAVKKAASTKTRTAPAKAEPGRAKAKPTPKRAATRVAVLRAGSKGAQVTALQRRLESLGYWVPAQGRGYFGHGTSQAVTALQKVAGLPRTGRVDAATARALSRGVRPTARSRAARAVEIDRRRQVLLVVRSGRVTRIVNTSTGLPPDMTTPAGTYRIERQVNGWRQAPLGGLYRPKYFHRGYAVHGVRDGGIPPQAASHGCARVSMAAMDMLWGPDGARVGDRVLVY